MEDPIITPIQNCTSKDPDDGTCGHPDNMTPECHQHICPIVRRQEKPIIQPVGSYVRSLGKLIAIENVTPPVVEVLDYIYLETTARVEARVNGKPIKVFSTFNEFYGEGTAVQQAIKEAKAEAIKAGPSSLEFVVVMVRSHVRKRPSSHRGACFYDTDFRAMETIEHGSKRDLPEDLCMTVFSVTNPSGVELIETQSN